jgi:hypothetical protein
MSVREDVQFHMLTSEEKAAVRMWFALGLDIETKGLGKADHINYWVPVKALKHRQWGIEPQAFWCYRLIR